MPFRRNYKKRAYGRRKYKSAKKALGKSTASAVKAIVKSQMNKVIESKNLDYSLEPIPLACLYHNVPSALDDDMCYSQQGTFDEEIAIARNRVGDSIFVKNIQLKLMLTSFSTRPNCTYRITVVKTKNGSVSLPGGSSIYGHPQCGNNMISPVDTELSGLSSVVYDRVINSNAFQTAQTGNTDKKFIWTYSIKVNRKIKYDNSGANSSSPSYRLFLTAYDTQGALITDNIARYTYFRRTHFLDA